eukprot:4267674-Prorocentrum_lima.AAC.1
MEVFVPRRSGLMCWCCSEEWAGFQGDVKTIMLEEKRAHFDAKRRLQAGIAVLGCPECCELRCPA